MASNEELIYNKVLELYPSSMKTLTEVSKNTTGDNKLLESDYLTFDFDIVENCHISYTNRLHKSPDSLIYYNKALYFVEFKEGNACTLDIRAKIHEAVATLHTICVKYLPQISREDFFNLNIKYAVVMRKGNPSTFLNTLHITKNKFHLKNLEGYLLKRTKVTNNPEDIFNLFRLISDGNLVSLNVYNREHGFESFSA